MPSASNRLRASSRAQVCILREASNVSQASYVISRLIEADSKNPSLPFAFDRFGTSPDNRTSTPRQLTHTLLPSRSTANIYFASLKTSYSSHRLTDETARREKRTETDTNNSRN